MRFKSNVEPNYGDFRVVKKFAWLPVEASNLEYTWIWLEKYDSHEVYVNTIKEDRDSYYGMTTELGTEGWFRKEAHAILDPSEQKEAPEFLKENNEKK